MSKINWLYLYLLKIKIHIATEEGFCIFFKDYLYSLLVFSGSEFRELPKESVLKLYTGSNANFDLSVCILIHKMRTVSVLVSLACITQYIGWVTWTTEIHFLPVFHIGNPRSGFQYGWGLVRDLFLVCG